MYGKGGSKAELRPVEVDPYFERERNTLGGEALNLSATIFGIQNGKTVDFVISRKKNELHLKSLGFYLCTEAGRSS